MVRAAQFMHMGKPSHCDLWTDPSWLLCSLIDSLRTGSVARFSSASREQLVGTMLSHAASDSARTSHRIFPRRRKRRGGSGKKNEVRRGFSIRIQVVLRRSCLRPTAGVSTASNTPLTILQSILDEVTKVFKIVKYTTNYLKHR